ncbi:transposase, partial [Streptomyces sp. NPDC004129]
MSLRPEKHQRIPVRTVRTARAACPNGTPAMLIRDRLDVLFEDEEFAGLYPPDGRPGLSPGQLALVSVLQFAGNLSDRAAADAVRTRTDWKYALGLELDDPGFDYSVLCEFRARLAENGAADQLETLTAVWPPLGTNGIRCPESGKSRYEPDFNPVRRISRRRRSAPEETIRSLLGPGGGLQRLPGVA